MCFTNGSVVRVGKLTSAFCSPGLGEYFWTLKMLIHENRLSRYTPAIHLSYMQRNTTDCVMGLRGTYRLCAQLAMHVRGNLQRQKEKARYNWSCGS